MIINPHKEHYRVFSTQYSRQDADEDGASQYTEKVLFKQVSRLFSKSFAAAELLKVCISKGRGRFCECKNATRIDTTPKKVIIDSYHRHTGGILSVLTPWH